jgi:CTP synthase
MHEEHKNKLSLFCNVKREMVVEEQTSRTQSNEVPIYLAKQSLDTNILRLLDLPANHLDLREWEGMPFKRPQSGARRGLDRGSR